MIEIYLDEPAAAFMESMTINALSDAATDFNAADQKKEPEQYRLARLRLVTAAQILAQLTNPVHTLNPSPAGMDFDPRASAPRCTHGVLFTEPCETCAANTPMDSLPPEVGPEVVAGIQP